MRLFVITVGDLHAASSHYRIRQYLPFFQQQGLEIECVSQHDFNPSMLRKDDIVFNQKCLLTHSFKQKVIFDFDDAIYTRPGKPFSFLTQLRVNYRLRAILKSAHHVITANDHLATYARRYSQSVTVLPMALDLTRWLDIRGIGLVNRCSAVQAFSQYVSIGMAMILLLPSFILLLYLVFARLGDPVWLAMLAVALPRLFQVLAFSHELLFELANWPMEQANIKTLLDMVNTPTSLQLEDLMKRIKWEMLTTTSHPTVDNLLQRLPKTGRITITGDNGSGKTSLLMLLKQQHGDQAFYLPAKHELLFEISHPKVSTGQRACQVLRELHHKVDAPIILLDEWDANLDKNNSNELSNIIDVLSTKYCVIETRHARGFATL